MAKGGKRSGGSHPHGWGSSPNMWRDPKTVNGRSGGKGCLVLVGGFVGFVVAAVGAVGVVWF